MDELLAQLFDAPRDLMDSWITPGRYITGRQLAEHGLAEMIDLATLPGFKLNGAATRSRPKAKRKEAVS